MNKKQFLDRLKRELSKLNDEEIKRHLDFYEEMINDRVDEGVSEEAAVQQLGTVQGIAAKILSEASPEQLRKKKIGKLGWIFIALAALLLIGGAVVIEEYLDYRFDSEGVDVEEMLEERIGLEDGWIFGGADARIGSEEVSSVELVWSCGDVTVDEADGRDIVIKAGDEDSIEYQVKDGTLYIETRKEYTKANSDLRIYIPDDIMQLNRLDIVTTDGKVIADCEYFAEVSVVTAGGDVRLNPEDSAKVDVTTASGDVLLTLDEENAFNMDYKTDSGDVSVRFDRSFVNASGSGKPASYDHSRGNANALYLNISTADGDIKLFDD